MSILAVTIPCEWRFLDSGAGAPAFNMSLDEALLEALRRMDRPVLRCYGWTEPAASFGYFQKYVEVERMTMLRPLVRRPTGGGLVPHDADWTYSLAIPTSHEWYSITAMESYRRMHAWLQAAFQILNIETELAACCHKTGPGQCFAGYEKFDLLWHGRKIAGAAQRRRRDGLLIQGSVQTPVASLQRSAWQGAMRGVLERERMRWSELELKLEPELLERAKALAEQKYSQPVYNQRRSEGRAPRVPK